MQLICVVDNAVAPSSPLWGEHGLLFMVESQGQRILISWRAARHIGSSDRMIACDLHYKAVSSSSAAREM